MGKDGPYKPVAVADENPAMRPFTISRRQFSLAGLSMFLPVSAAAEESKVWRAGNYSFSDELGGFIIRSVSGKGTPEDPIVIEEELNSASPVTMMVRAAAIGDSVSSEGNLASSSLFLRIVILNGSGQSWIEFEFELQEILNKPSDFGDGLSFDQRRENSGSIGSSNFSHFDRDFEPYDRLLFTQGKVDAKQTVEFNFALTDFTPRWSFYIVQDPRIPYS